MPDDDTPRVTWHIDRFRLKAEQLGVRLRWASLAFEKRLPILDFAAARRCLALADEADMLVKAIDIASKTPGERAERRAKIWELIKALQAEAETLIERTRTP